MKSIGGAAQKPEKKASGVGVKRMVDQPSGVDVATLNAASLPYRKPRNQMMWNHFTLAHNGVSTTINYADG